MSTFKLSVVTHEKQALEEEVEFLKVRTSEGDMGILANHSPLVAELATGEMELKNSGKVDKYFLSGGFLEISNNVVTIIVDEILAKDEIDYQHTEKEIEEVKELLKKLNKQDKEFVLAEQKLKESLVKLEMIKK